MGLWKRIWQAIRIEQVIALLEDPAERAKGLAMYEAMPDPERLSERYLELVRLVRNTRNARSRRIKLLLEGVVKPGESPPEGAAGFVRHSIVIAPDVEKGRAVAEELLKGEAAWAELRILESEDLGPAAEELEGVVELSGPIWYGDDSDRAVVRPSSTDIKNGRRD